MRATGVRRATLSLAAGEELFAFAARIAAGLGGCAALLDFEQVPMRRVALHVPEPDPSGRQIMRYGDALAVEAASVLVGAQMSIGGTPAAPVLHGHGEVRLADGRRLGGHLSPGGCVAAEPATVRCTVLEGIGLAPAFDDETGFSLLGPVALEAAPADIASRGDAARGRTVRRELAPGETVQGEIARSETAPHTMARNPGLQSLPPRSPTPQSSTPQSPTPQSPTPRSPTPRSPTSQASIDGTPDRREAASLDRPAVVRGPGWLLRLKPDEDLVEALDALVRVHGIARPRVVGGVGSLMGATLRDADGRLLRIEGPGVEILGLRNDGGELRMVVADLEGGVHRGTPTRGGNPICVTIELFVAEAG